MKKLDKALLVSDLIILYLIIQLNNFINNFFQSVYDIQNTIREGVVACHTLLEELRQNTDTEKLTIHNFVQTLHDAINKIQTDMHLEVQR